MSDTNFQKVEAKNHPSPAMESEMYGARQSNSMVNTDFLLSPHDRLRLEEKTSEKILELSRTGNEHGIYPRAGHDGAEAARKLIESGKSLQKRGILPEFSLKAEAAKDYVSHTNVSIEVTK
ncbi:MAG: hypothetical protein IAF58_06775 [Leptolyngbya sp.]|nr:hypothetical protein [Candidatus Melainabacteria bacterium]